MGSDGTKYKKGPTHAPTSDSKWPSSRGRGQQGLGEVNRNGKNERSVERLTDSGTRGWRPTRCVARDC